MDATLDPVVSPGGAAILAASSSADIQCSKLLFYSIQDGFLLIGRNGHLPGFYISQC